MGKLCNCNHDRIAHYHGDHYCIVRGCHCKEFVEKGYARVTLFRESGKYYTEEVWAIPYDAIGPYDMSRSKDFRRIDNGPVLVPTQEPWGYPHLFPSEPKAKPSIRVYNEKTGFWNI